VARVEVKCMNCEKASDVPVIESTNEAILSCRNCDEQMIAKIHRIAFSE
jgi:peptide subunit release factor 1 (eRF1)